jgi:hypothetical protein
LAEADSCFLDLKIYKLNGEYATLAGEFFTLREVCPPFLRVLQAMMLSQESKIVDG